MNIEEEVYKGFKIIVEYNKEDKSFHGCSLCGNSCDEFDSTRKNFSMGHETPTKALNDVKSIIDKFINLTPKNYQELADMLSEHLTWDGYEDCRLVESIVETLVENFIKFKQSKQ